MVGSDVPGQSTSSTAATSGAQDLLPGRQLTGGAVVSVMVSPGQLIAMVPPVVWTCRVESQDPGGGVFDTQGATVALVISINPTGTGHGC